MDVACAWELFHAFLLAHDDIIDAADSRRGEPSLHRRLASLDADSIRSGSNLAIIAGDLLFCASMRLLHELDLPDDTFRPVLKLFSRIACTTGYGQAIDVCQSHAVPGRVFEDEVLRQYHWKTAAYTFEGPMLSGALLAGLGEAARRALSAFALSLGQAYQLQNDLVDLGATAHEGCDLVQGKRTVTLLRARSTMPDGQRMSFDHRLTSLRTANGKAVGIAEALRQELLDTGAARQTHELIDGFLAAARAAASDPAMPPLLAEGMAELLASLESRYFTPK